ncbi:MAG TPA: DUF6231 family protein [Gammaproteobacteria bacterium]|nr:DUF6231 family protein [Gammaproteobacteria bacterium]
MQKLPEECITQIQQLVDTINPASLLLGGDDDRAGELAEIMAEKNIQNVTSVTGANIYSRICKLGVFDLVILAGIETIQKKAAMQLIGRIRDFHARHLLVMVLTDRDQSSAEFASYWQRQDFIACGMRLFNKYPAGKHELQIYRFEMSDYKVTPEWFNSKFWANPELFDKFRW